uniref:Uncharacterized protein n=1 Tax=Anguilla anguilla TaxID=7936 RepID=A0A0E9SVW9_ANGAN
MFNPTNFVATTSLLSEINDIFPLSVYVVNGRLTVTLKCYILCRISFTHAFIHLNGL